MIKRMYLIAAPAAIISLAAAHSADAGEIGPSARCTDVSVPKTAIEKQGGKWIELTHDQWGFLRGVFVLNPNTPPGLPYGDKAVLAQAKGDAGGLVFFIDGDRACTPMAIPGVLVSMIRDVGMQNIPHEADQASGL